LARNQELMKSNLPSLCMFFFHKVLESTLSLMKLCHMH
jgi:hypothetical protein